MAQLAPPLGSLEPLGTDLRCQQAQSLPALRCLKSGIQPAGGSGDVQSITRCLLLPTLARRSAGERRWKTQHQHPGALRGLWVCGQGLRGCAGVCFPLAISLDRDAAWGSFSSPLVVTVSWDRDAR